ncbi:hypothetical protein Pmani_019261 [Petrolisthes manimaculis]|uniref:Secreted protein n=1 Tax=Petrolisthes manimaculis TaxID=1843537 RepID=A0AAE1PII5_9EUCA|nr:hypothetical protein Pmani_019261 [Petrolisthes manimaculis]
MWMLCAWLWWHGTAGEWSTLRAQAHHSSSPNMEVVPLPLPLPPPPPPHILTLSSYPQALLTHFRKSNCLILRHHCFSLIIFFPAPTPAPLSFLTCLLSARPMMLWLGNILSLWMAPDSACYTC